jgi:molybdenum cofactor cytidylyltransferase
MLTSFSNPGSVEVGVKAFWKKPTAGIILAAGMSRRFGEPKQLIELHGKPVVEWVLEAALKSRLEDIVLVLGYRSRQIVTRMGALANDPRIRIVVNHDYETGQSSSLRSGISQIDGVYPSAMFLLGDQPLVDSRTIDYLLDRFRSSRKHICVPVYQGKMGNPAIFSKRFYHQIQSIREDTGARQIIADNPDQVLEVAMDHPFCLMDIDTREDFEKIQSLVENLSLPACNNRKHLDDVFAADRGVKSV